MSSSRSATGIVVIHLCCLEDTSVPRIRFEEHDLDDYDLPDDRHHSRRRDRRHRADRLDDSAGSRRRRRDTRRPEDESFKCGHCKAFIGPTVSGGRHRNHCPLCLFSRHVDDRRPGDRASDCRSLMAPIGTFFRPNGEQVVVHRCLGCGCERHCRVAADDNIVACMQLPLVAPRSARGGAALVDEEAIA